jgi:hypothetical protein
VSDVKFKIAEILTSQFISIFHNALKAPLVQVPDLNHQLSFDSPGYCASIGLKGTGIEASIVIVTDKKFLHQTHPERRYGEALAEEDYLDWLAEICNRTLAGSKPFIFELGYQLGLELPQAMQGLSDIKVSAELTRVLESGGFYASLGLSIIKIEAPIKAAG